MGRRDLISMVHAIGVLIVLFGFAGIIQAQPIVCSTDADCEDGLFCTRDQCIGGSCGVITACPPFIDGCVTRAGYCDEDNDECVDVADDSLCDDGVFCNGTETCDLETGNCVAVSACPPAIDGCVTRGGECDEVNDMCVDVADDSLCGDGQFCDVITGLCLDSNLCSLAQQAAQEAVASGGPYKNHGQMVKTAAHAANLYLYEGDISEECHSCIVSQFARRIPIAEQEVCNYVISQCPITLIPSEYGYWYEMYPNFWGVAEINLRVVLTNAHSETLEFDDDTFQLWSVPSVLETMPVTINEVPVDPVAPGETLTYDLTIDVSGLPATEYTLAFRAVSLTLGTMDTSKVPLYEVTITCE